MPGRGRKQNTEVRGFMVGGLLFRLYLDIGTILYVGWQCIKQRETSVADGCGCGIRGDISASDIFTSLKMRIWRRVCEPSLFIDVGMGCRTYAAGGSNQIDGNSLYVEWVRKLAHVLAIHTGYFCR
jgi:hypothetical protein